MSQIFRCFRTAVAAMLAVASVPVAAQAQAPDVWPPVSRTEDGHAAMPRAARPRAQRQRDAQPSQVRTPDAKAQPATAPAQTGEAAPPRTNGDPHVEPLALDALVDRLTKGSFTLVEGTGKVLGTRRRGEALPTPLSEPAILASLQGVHLTPEQAAPLWSFLADQDNAGLLTLPIVKAATVASDLPKAREALWGELAALARAFLRGDPARSRERSLLGLFERNRTTMRPLLTEIAETDAGHDEIIELMQSSRVFGAELEESVWFIAERIPAAVARRIEREREMGRRMRWEYMAYEGMVRWKNARLLPGAPKAATSLAELDAFGAVFVITFNCLHSLDIGFREVILRGLGPVELFNAVVAGEQELYRLGTSGYRKFLHSIIMRGIQEAGSFEAFLDAAVPRQFGEDAARASAHRGMVFLRVVSSFGLIDQVLQTVHDRERFIAGVVASLADPSGLEGNSSVVLDVLTGDTDTPVVRQFKGDLLAHLYDGYRAAGQGTRLANVYGSMLSVYQTLTGDRRDDSIDRRFALDSSIFRVPFERLFTADSDGRWSHRMIMRMDDNLDAEGSLRTFRGLMRSLGAVVRDAPNYSVFSFAAADRRIEIYVNLPTAAGLKQGLPAIAEALRGQRVDTVIGRGHTSIIAPLQSDMRRVLGTRVRQVALVIVGSCGGDVSVHDLIGTFGYIPFFTTKSTGRQVINNAIIRSYIAALMALKPGERLAMADVLDRGIERYLRPDVDPELRADAALYQMNMSTVLSSLLFDAHVRGAGGDLKHRHAAGP